MEFSLHLLALKCISLEICAQGEMEALIFCIL